MSRIGREDNQNIASKSVENSPDDDVPDYCQVVHFTDCKGQTRKVLFPKGLDLDRPKRSRTSFNQWQLDALEREFLRCHGYVVGKDRTNLSKSLGLTETQVKVWFQNRRTKFKKDADGKSDSNKQAKNVLSLPTSVTSPTSTSPAFQLGVVTPPSLPLAPPSSLFHHYHPHHQKPPSLYIPTPTYKDYLPSVTRATSTYFNHFS